MEETVWNARNLVLNDVWYIIKAARYTLLLSAISLVGGLILAVIIGILRTTPKLKALNVLSRIYVEIFRGIPVLIQIFIFYYGLIILFGLRLPALISVSIAFILWFGANIGETLTGIIDNIPKGQWDGSTSLGLNYLQQIRYVIFPQVVRAATPPSVGLMVGLIKETSLASIVGFLEITRAGRHIMATTGDPLTTFPIVAALYFIICFIIVPRFSTSEANSKNENCLFCHSTLTEFSATSNDILALVALGLYKNFILASSMPLSSILLTTFLKLLLYGWIITN